MLLNKRVLYRFFSYRCILTFIWIYSITVSVLLPDINVITLNNDGLVCSPRWTKNSLKAILAAVLCFWLPSIIVFISNISIIRAIRNLHSVSSNHNSSTEEDDNSNVRINCRIESLRSFYVLVIVYFICGSPYFLGKFSYDGHEAAMISSHEESHHSSIMVFFMVLLFIASAVNPFIYPLLGKEHRKAFEETVEILNLEKKRILTTTKMKFKIFTYCCKMSDKNSI